jgi:hypothetical protein
VSIIPALLGILRFKISMLKESTFFIAISTLCCI